MKNLKEVKPNLINSAVYNIRLLTTMIILVLLTATALPAAAAEKATAHARVAVIHHRVNEIRAMDLNTLSVSEKKELKGELKSMQKELRSMHPTYVYISGGGLLLIILILILLL